MASNYWLQLAHSNEGRWEEVDAFIFENWKFAVVDEGEHEGQSRYNGNRVCSIDGQVEIETETKLRTKDIVWIARFLGATPNEWNGVVQGGIVREVDYVKMVKRQQVILKKVNGPKFVAREEKKSDETE
jgi:hypothetical protein